MLEMTKYLPLRRCLLLLDSTTLHRGHETQTSRCDDRNDNPLLSPQPDLTVLMLTPYLG